MTPRRSGSMFSSSEIKGPMSSAARWGGAAVFLQLPPSSTTPSNKDPKRRCLEYKKQFSLDKAFSGLRFEVLESRHHGTLQQTSPSNRFIRYIDGTISFSVDRQGDFVTIPKVGFLPPALTPLYGKPPPTYVTTMNVTQVVQAKQRIRL